MSSLLDQSALTDLAERLVAAARRAGADDADAVAVRSMSLAVEVREGAVEESERAEGDDVGLRVFVGRRQAVVSTNDVNGDVAPLAERAVAMARAAPEDPYAGLADARELAREVPDLDLLDPDLPSVALLEQRAKEAEAAALAVKGVSKSGGASASAGIGGMVLVTSQGFHGAYLSSGQSVMAMAIAGEGTAMERDYDYSSVIHGADLDPPERIGRTAGERAVERLNPRKIETKRVIELTFAGCRGIEQFDPLAIVDFDEGNFDRAVRLRQREGLVEAEEISVERPRFRQVADKDRHVRNAQDLRSRDRRLRGRGRGQKQRPGHQEWEQRSHAPLGYPVRGPLHNAELARLDGWPRMFARTPSVVNEVDGVCGRCARLEGL